MLSTNKFNFILFILFSFIHFTHNHICFFFTVDENKYTKIADGLLIKRVFKNDSGEYSCKAFQISSALSNVKEQTIRLNIQREYHTNSIINSTVNSAW